MKKRSAFVPGLFLLACDYAFAHPGHGKLGWFHYHGELLADLALIFFVFCAVAALGWGVKKLLFK